MLVRKLDIERRIYIPPCICFEEIEADANDMLMTKSTDSGTGGDPEYGDGDDDIKKNSSSSLDLDFSMDFVVNNDPQL